MSFSIVAGFFIGLIFSIVKFNSPELIILWTIICTIVLYLITTLCVSLYMMFIDYNNKEINKEKLNSTLEYYLSEFDRREKELLSIRKYLKHSLSRINEEKEN